MKKKPWWVGPIIIVFIIVLLSVAVNIFIPTPDVSLPDAGHNPEYKQLTYGTNPNAKVTFVEFVDFQCPFLCRVSYNSKSITKRFPKQN